MKTPNPLLYYCDELQSLLNKARKEKHSALWLYQNNMRTSLFMIESLLRLFNYDLKYAGFNTKHKLVKKLEDALGEIDFYDAILKEFTNNKIIGVEIKSYLDLKKTKALKKFGKKLNKSKWLNKGFSVFETEIHDSGLVFNKSTGLRIEKIIRAELFACKKFAESRNYRFTKTESELHEMRRKLRWISIYGASLRGIIKLTTDKKNYSWKKKYHSKSVINSPYNKLPISNECPYCIIFEKNHFLALSWIIQELGVLKDRAMTVEVIAKAIRKTNSSSKNGSIKEAEGLLKIKTSPDTILKQGSAIIKEFFVKNKIAQGLLLRN